VTSPPGQRRPAAPDAPDGPDAVERLWPSPWVWLAVAVLAGFSAVVALPFGPTPGLVTFGVAAAALGAVLLRASPSVGVRDGEFVAGRAHVPVTLLGNLVPLDAEALRRQAGPQLDARAHLLLRGWVRGGLRLELVDPQDPTPYWLVSARHPERLAAAVEAARPGPGGQAAHSRQIG